MLTSEKVILVILTSHTLTYQGASSGSTNYLAQIIRRLLTTTLTYDQNTIKKTKFSRFEAVRLLSSL